MKTGMKRLTIAAAISSLAACGENGGMGGVAAGVGAAVLVGAIAGGGGGGSDKGDDSPQGGVDPEATPQQGGSPEQGGGPPTLSDPKAIDEQTVSPGVITRLSINNLQDRSGVSLGSEVTATSSDPNLQVAMGKNGSVNMLSTASPAEDKVFTVTLTGDGKSIAIPVRIIANLPTALLIQSEAPEDQDAKAAPSVTMVPLPGNVLSAASAPSFQITLPNDAGVDLSQSQLRVDLLRSNADVTPSFSLAGDKITINLAGLNTLLSALSPTELNQFTFEVRDENYETIVFDVQVYYGKSAVNVQLVNDTGQPTTVTPPTLFVMRGQKSQAVYTFTTGSFASVQGVVPDIYRIESADLTEQVEAVGNVEVSADVADTNATVQQLSSPSTAPMFSTKLQTDIRTGEPLPECAPVIDVPSFPNLPKQWVNGSARHSDEIFQIDLRAQERFPSEKCKAVVKIPPEYRSVRLEFLDLGIHNHTTFGYTIKLAGQTFQDRRVIGSDLNSNGYGTGSLRAGFRSECFALSPRPNEPTLMTVDTALSRSRFDDSLPSSMHFELFTCDFSLNVGSFKAYPVNNKGYSLFRSPNAKAASYRVLSIPTASTPQIGFGAAVEYFPTDAQITKVELLYGTPGGLTEIDLGDVKSQATSIENGLIKFTNLIPPAKEVTLTGKAELRVRLTGKVKDPNGNLIDSTTETPVAMEMAAETEFYPLFDAHTKGATQRFNSDREAAIGGDAWASPAMIDWLKTSGRPPYNDVAAIHGARTSAGGKVVANTDTGKSILKHKGHSDGVSVDLRYKNSAGGFVESKDNPGAGLQNENGILALIPAAKSELGTTGDTPNLNKIRQWISLNREMMETYAREPNYRKMHIGDGALALLLVDGKLGRGGFLSGIISPAVPGVSVWNHPKFMTSVKGHTDHWHIEYDFNR